MRLGELLDGAWAGLGSRGDISIERVVEDSRVAGPGTVFVAVKGGNVDGHRFVSQALETGAECVVAESSRRNELPQDERIYFVEDTRLALGTLNARLHGNPQKEMALFGITGTNGKTTTTFLLEHILQTARRKPGIIGTVSYRFAGHEKPAAYTTPTPELLYSTLKEMKEHGCDTACMEVSSIALAAQRVDGLLFDVAAFSNLTQDHLDVHGGMEAYARAKATLFSRYLKPDGVAVLNRDDPAFAVMGDGLDTSRTCLVSIREPADVWVSHFTSSAEGITARMEVYGETISVSCKALIGEYNVANVAMATAVAHHLGVPLEQIKKALDSVPGVPGRVQRAPNDEGLNIFVDYAHTPDALENVLAALRPITKGRLLCVFGCGGDRDPLKRPLMGAVAGEKADLVFVTSDNPRTEEPWSIIHEILNGMDEPFFVHPDRRAAIQAAVATATPQDVVLIAGKGHEDYQILGTEKVHFDDREEATKAAAKRLHFSSELLSQVLGAHVERDVSRIVIDTRVLVPGDGYLAIRGTRFDGHEFVKQAEEKGAALAIVENLQPGLSMEQVKVADTLKALGHIAGAHRTRWGKTVVGVTGSNGKTTTKKLIAGALSSQLCVHATRGSLNNETGVPLTLLGLSPAHEMAVIEMGMRHVGDIGYLCEFVRPDVAVVVNAGLAHVGVAGSEDAIVRGKSEIWNGAPIAVCPQDPRLLEFARQCEKVVTFGTTTGATVQLLETRYENGRSENTFLCDGKKWRVSSSMVGDHNALNMACAIAVAHGLSLDLDGVCRQLAFVKPESLRGQMRLVGGRNVFVDCYNANPDSMAASFHTVQKMADTGRVVAVVGDMLELGDIAPAEHERLGKLAKELGFTSLATGEFRELWNGEKFSKPEEAASWLLDHTNEGDWVLVKGSRGMALEHVVEAFEQLVGEVA